MYSFNFVKVKLQPLLEVIVWWTTVVWLDTVDCCFN